ncbi:hypothetical protein [Sulfurisoma sediminicola]|uniref:Uncharacterized protein n=1 Tax=Sulfurisoma sediminicola TaxID=1381557 RepID=A0A497XCF9_9PROT|nr:hypothetical protein [Sulfurisoma sediminicola]RLJ64601.1 hypothetical protein DFR35_1242 [Sulfurisoma sediminicola]
MCNTPIILADLLIQVIAKAGDAVRLGVAGEAALAPLCACFMKSTGLPARWCVPYVKCGDTWRGGGVAMTGVDLPQGDPAVVEVLPSLALVFFEGLEDALDGGIVVRLAGGAVSHTAYPGPEHRADTWPEWAYGVEGLAQLPYIWPGHYNHLVAIASGYIEA